MVSSDTQAENRMIQDVYSGPRMKVENNAMINQKHLNQEDPEIVEKILSRESEYRSSS